MSRSAVPSQPSTTPMMNIEAREIVFACSARQRVKKTSPVLLSVPNWAPGLSMSSPARDECGGL
jgi:hypothetical protein